MRVPSARDAGWLGFGLGALALVVAGYALLVVLSQANVADAPGIAPKTVAFSPGSSFNVATFCKAADSVTFSVQPDVNGATRQAKKGQQRVEWPDKGDLGDGAAVHYWIDKNGQQQSENVEVTLDAADCMRMPK